MTFMGSQEIYLLQLFLGVSMMSFVITLLLPKALALKRSSVRKPKLPQSFQYHLNEERSMLSTSRRDNYVSLKNIDVCTDAKVAATSCDQHEKMSSLDRIENGFGYQNIFRTRKTKKGNKEDTLEKGKLIKKGMQHSMAQRVNILESRSPSDKISRYEELLNSSTTRSNSSIFSIGSDYEHPKRENTCTQDDTNLCESEHLWDVKPNWKPNSAVINNKESDFSFSTRIKNRPSLSLLESRDLNDVSRGGQVDPKPNSLHSLNNEGDHSTNLEYTPSPLSLTSRVNLRDESGFVVLVGGNLQGEENMRQIRPIELLHSKGFNYSVVDATATNQAKRREDLIMLSGIRGHYPQIFLINDRGQGSYLGNHENIFQLERQGKLDPAVLCHHMESKTLSNILAKVVDVDSSFFSV